MPLAEAGEAAGHAGLAPGLLVWRSGFVTPSLKVGEVIDVDQRGNRPPILADRHRAVASPRLGHKLGQVRLSRGQRIRHDPDRNTGPRPHGQTEPLDRHDHGALATAGWHAKSQPPHTRWQLAGGGHDHGTTAPGSCSAKSEIRDPTDRVPRLVIEWTGDLPRLGSGLNATQ